MLAYFLSLLYTFWSFCRGALFATLPPAARPLTLPPRPPNICAPAWEGVFAAQLGISGDKLRRIQDAEGCGDNDPSCWTGGYAYTVSSVTWLECARSGCLWCKFIEKHFLDRIKPDWSHGLVPDLHVRVGAEDSNIGNGVNWVLNIFVRYRGTAFRKCLSVHASPDDPAAAYIEGRIRSPRVGTPKVLAMAKAWLEECTHDHEVCQRTGALDSAPWLPTRLVDCSDLFRIRIIETNGNLLGARYVALSYVWGTRGQLHQTTTANLSLYGSVGIEVATLPQTIRDAIHVTRALGFYLLWLDTLCIVQDSPEDKIRELRSMRNVYSHAYITIDAASAASVDEGFLQDRSPVNPEATLPFICPVGRGPEEQAPDQERVGTVYFQDAVTSIRIQFYNRADDSYEEEIRRSYKSETGRRGWCLQEASLSPRYLVFDKDTLRLRCQAAQHKVGFRGQDYQDHFPIPRLYSVTLQGTSPPPPSTVTPGSREWKATYNTWQTVVEDYSRRLLSYQSDKLVACAAIAEAFAPALGPDYLAGLWRSSLLFDLAWESRQRPREYPYAPSWSWASAKHGIHFPRLFPSLDFDIQVHAVAEVVECNVQSEVLRFGPVQPGGYLVLHAVLFPCTWESPGFDAYGKRTAALAEDLVPLSDSRKVVPAPRLKVKLDYEDDEHLQDIYLVPLGVVTDELIYGLVVARTEWSVRRQSVELAARGEVYERVGFWREEPSHLCWTTELDVHFEDVCAYMVPRLGQDTAKVQIVLV
ncbi:heterokaryon incompatibility protein-domain-containing protein [Cubamyces menziesii]|nr:heterokaryon incompatibility protein-domain-containing protein [Cubamyces menziesii]